MREQQFFEAQTVFPSLRMNAESSATYLRALVESSPIAIVVLDAQHRYAMCNHSFVELFQYTREELAGTDLDELIACPDRLEEAVSLSRLVLQRTKIHKVTQRRRRDGMIVDVEVFGIPLIVDGKLEGVYGLYQDVTERNRAQTALRQISDEMETLQQSERRRIARDLHDSTSQELAVLNWNLTRLESLVHEGSDTLKSLVRETKEIASVCSARIRSASYLLHPPLLGETGLTQTLPGLAEGFEQRSGIRVDLDLGSDLGRFRDEVEITIFRVVQEALANVLRHSGSPAVRISLFRRGFWLELEISDQGKGRDGETACSGRSGVGISGMRERVEQLGGFWNISCNDEGTTIVAMVPTEVASHG
jgi:two-component system NarL family sensor kinase